jgi:putative membrane protein
MNRRAIHEGVFHIASADLPAIRLWSFNVGFYNLFLAAAPVAGVIALHAGDQAVGRALVIYGCSFMVLAGIVLAVSDRMGLGRARGTGLSGALGQGVPPMIALVAATF